MSITNREEVYNSFHGLIKEGLSEQLKNVLKSIHYIYEIPITSEEWYIEQPKEISRLYAEKRALEIKIENA